MRWAPSYCHSLTGLQPQKYATTLSKHPTCPCHVFVTIMTWSYSCMSGVDLSIFLTPYQGFFGFLQIASERQYFGKTDGFPFRNVVWGHMGNYNHIILVFSPKFSSNETICVTYNVACFDLGRIAPCAPKYVYLCIQMHFICNNCCFGITRKYL